jgi:periplasmic divalent cation tolerance protein
MPESPQQFRIVVTTAGSEEQAARIASALVERRLAACVNVVGQVCSTYRWKGAIEREDEKLLLIKTEQRRLDEVMAAIRELHTYELPEAIALPVEQGDPAYLRWLSESVR